MVSVGMCKKNNPILVPEVFNQLSNCYAFRE